MRYFFSLFYSYQQVKYAEILLLAKRYQKNVFYKQACKVWF